LKLGTSLTHGQTDNTKQYPDILNKKWGNEHISVLVNVKSQVDLSHRGRN